MLAVLKGAPTMNREPQTLIEAIRYFADPDVALDFVVKMRWPDGNVTCPTCGSDDVRFIPTRRIWECKAKHAKRQFSVKVGTIFEDSPISLDKWLATIWLIANAKNGVSSYEIARAIGVTQKTAWFMLHRIRLAMQSDDFGPSNGHVEVDETFIGGKARNMHKGRREALGQGRGTIGKIAVMGVLERNQPDRPSSVRMEVLPSTQTKHIDPAVRRNVEPGSTVYTDALASYRHLETEYVHHVIDHAETYVNGKVHTNGIENFWSLLKRAIRGTYVSVEPFHLFRYLDEQAFRFNGRRGDDASRFQRITGRLVGKRLTYGQLTGKTMSTTPA